MRNHSLKLRTLTLLSAAWALSACSDDGPAAPDALAPDPDAPAIYADARYTVRRSTQVYAQGLSHSSWGSDTTQVVDLMLDLYEPVDAPAGRPAILWIHGGGFTGGSRTNGAMSFMANWFAQRGWVTASIDYRLAGARGTVPEAWLDLRAPLGNNDEQIWAMYTAARDGRAALRWFHANSSSLGIDPDYVTVGGGSAGAFTAIAVGVAEPDDFRTEISAADDPTVAGTNPAASTAVRSIVDFWGGDGILVAYESAFGVNRFDRTDPPILIIHGDRDATVDFGEAEELRDIWTANGVPHEFVRLSGIGHAAWSSTVDGQELHEVVFDFLVEQQRLRVTGS